MIFLLNQQPFSTLLLLSCLTGLPILIGELSNNRANYDKAVQAWSGGYKGNETVVAALDKNA